MCCNLHRCQNADYIGSVPEGETLEWGEETKGGNSGDEGKGEENMRALTAERTAEKNQIPGPEYNDYTDIQIFEYRNQISIQRLICINLLPQVHSNICLCIFFHGCHILPLVSAHLYAAPICL